MSIENILNPEPSGGGPSGPPGPENNTSHAGPSSNSDDNDKERPENSGSIYGTTHNGSRIVPENASRSPSPVPQLEAVKAKGFEILRKYQSVHGSSKNARMTGFTMSERNLLRNTYFSRDPHIRLSNIQIEALRNSNWKNVSLEGLFFAIFGERP